MERRDLKQPALPGLEPEQLSLPGLAAGVSAPSARAELTDAVRRQPKRRLKTFAEWPKPGTRVGVWFGQGEGQKREVVYLVGELLGHDYDPDPDSGGMIGRVALDEQQEGLSESLKASLPRIVRARLSQLRKEEQGGAI